MDRAEVDGCLCGRDPHYLRVLPKALEIGVAGWATGRAWVPRVRVEGQVSSRGEMQGQDRIGGHEHSCLVLLMAFNIGIRVVSIFFGAQHPSMKESPSVPFVHRMSPTPNPVPIYKEKKLPSKINAVLGLLLAWRRLGNKIKSHGIKAGVPALGGLWWATCQSGARRKGNGETFDVPHQICSYRSIGDML
jgi:hypothetical protein